MLANSQITTKRKTLGQVLICIGCCCGRVDRGRPPVPVDWLKAQWKLHKLNITPLMVTELECAEEGCPPLETVIVILDKPGSPRQYKVFKPLAEVTAEDIAVLATGAAEDHHEH